MPAFVGGEGGKKNERKPAVVLPARVEINRKKKKKRREKTRKGL